MVYYNAIVSVGVGCVFNNGVLYCWCLWCGCWWCGVGNMGVGNMGRGNIGRDNMGWVVVWYGHENM